MLLALASCSSPQERAAEAAARAAQEAAAGNYQRARLDLLEAVRHRDDVVDYWLALAEVDLRLTDIPGAYDAYLRVHELDRNNIDALQSLGEIALGIGRVKDAEEYADALLAIDPENLRGGLVKGYVALRQKRYAEASRAADRILASFPLEDAPLVLKARAQFESGERDAAVALIERSIPVRGPSRLKLDTLIEQYGKTGDREALERTYVRYMAMEPDNVRIKLTYATLLYQHGKRAGAENLLLPLLASPEQAEAAATVMIDYGGASPSAALLENAAFGGSMESLVAVARVGLEKGYYDSVLRLLQPYASGPMTNGAAPAAALYAAALHGAGRAGEALQLAEQVLAFDESNPRALRIRALESLRGGDLDDALTNARIIVRDQPKSAADRLLLAQVYIARKDVRLAETTYREAYNDFPENDRIMEDYVAFLQRRQRPGAAVDVARQFTQRNASSAAGWRVLATACAANRDSACATEARQTRMRLEMAQPASQVPA